MRKQLNFPNTPGILPFFYRLFQRFSKTFIQTVVVDLPIFLCDDILCYGAKVKYFPIRLSQPFVKTVILDEESVTYAELLSSFLKVISRDEKEIL